MTLNSQPCRGLSHIAGKFSCQPGEKSKAEHYHIADPDEVSEVKSDLVEIMEQDWTDPNALNMRCQEADLSPTNTSRSSFAEDSDVSSGSTSTSEEKRAKDEKTLAIAGVAERDVADLGCETSTAQALQQRATAAKNSEDAAKVAAERHAAELALRKQLDVLRREAFFRIKAQEEEIQCLRAVATFQVDPPPTEEPETETSVGENSDVPTGSTSDSEEADPSPLNTSRSSFAEDSDVSSASTSPSKDSVWTPELVDAQRLIAELEEKNQALEESLSTLCEEAERSPSSTSSTSVGEDRRDVSSSLTSTREDPFWTSELVDAQLLIAELTEKNQALEERLSSLSEAAQKLLQITLAEVEGMPTPMASQAQELETMRLDCPGQRKERDVTMPQELRPTLLEFPPERTLPAASALRIHLASCGEDKLPAIAAEEKPQHSDGRGLLSREELTHQLKTADQAVELQMLNQETCRGQRSCDGGFLIPDVWPTLLKFLPVADVVEMQTRAVSRSLSSSKVWVEHLFDLLDLDSLPKHCVSDRKHPAIQWCCYASAKSYGNVAGAEEAKNDANNMEGFPGYRFWFNGLFVWHKLHPKMTLQFVQKLVHLYPSGSKTQTETCDFLSCHVMEHGVRGLKLPLADTVLAALRLNGLQTKNYDRALERLGWCHLVFGHLSNGFILEVLNISMSWEDDGLVGKAIDQLAHILDVSLMEDSEANLAGRALNAVVRAKVKGNTDELEAAKQRFAALLKKLRVNK